ncbi:unnamed protein product, partial [Amoebophrya sp. A25]|eukprot:GSA25T00024598001.1
MWWSKYCSRDHECRVRLKGESLLASGQTLPGGSFGYMGDACLQHCQIAYGEGGGTVGFQPSCQLYDLAMTATRCSYVIG